MKLYCHSVILPTYRGRCPIQYNLDSPLSRHDEDNDDDTEFEHDDDDDDDDDDEDEDEADSNAGAVACAENAAKKNHQQREHGECGFVSIALVPASPVNERETQTLGFAFLKFLEHVPHYRIGQSF